MCGIAGIYKLKANRYVDPESIVKMRDSLIRRGPDDKGIYFSEDRRICFAHTRLSIIDLTSLAHQPMSNTEGTVWLAYNGEIYNYRYLQDELRKEGCNFRSNSDTEVIIYGYEKWGIDVLLGKLRGMFAFAIYDVRAKEPKFIIARDRLGIKPLYYYQDSELLIFSSEVRAILKTGLLEFKQNKDAGIAFLIFGHIPSPSTTIDNIFSLPVGTYMLIEGEKIRFVQYYDLIDSFTKLKTDDSKNIYDNILSILTETISIHLISDAPLGIFLSGGIDSSGLVALASRMSNTPVVTLSIIFDEDAYSERLYQRMFLKEYETDHREIKITEKDFYDEINNIFEAMDQPTVDGVNTYFVSKAAKEVGLKTVLSGLGGDEIFCGYPLFKKIGLLKQIQAFPRLLKLPFYLTRNFNDKWSKCGYLFSNDDFSLYLVIRGLFAPEEVAKILNIPEKKVTRFIEDFKHKTQKAQPKTLEPVDWLSYMEINFYLHNQLLKDTDFMSMYHSLETRVPYLDHILMEYIVSIDSTLKINKNTPKPLLVKSLNDMLPKSIVFRKKQGFTFPFDLWVKRRGRQLLQEAVSKRNINKKYAEVLWRKFLDGRLHWSRIWALVVMGKQ